ncbi:TnsA endonuclease N-terminal domain-containing protein [Cytobacillus solani]|uniref:TnsA endonuclease N-terminal domain-containing protein n=1 Tax=Cytobacillus solani TaxID=1637975 RepID=UPI0011507AB9|nr:TnsA endonuclease N-terminal domain-containing protein [Cytobacillus solani]
MKVARKIKASNKLSIRGKHNSTKMHRMIPWESTLERDFIKLLDFDPTVINFRFQPERIDYVYQGKKLKYYPDFLVVKNDMKKYLYEVKAEDKINDEKNKIKFQVGLKYCGARNMKYLVVTEKDIRKGFLIENLDILTEVRPDSVCRKVQQVIIRVLEEMNGRTSIGSLKEIITYFDESEVENNVFYLIYTHQVLTDLITHLINDESIIERIGT